MYFFIFRFLTNTMPAVALIFGNARKNTNIKPIHRMFAIRDSTHLHFVDSATGA